MSVCRALSALLRLFPASMAASRVWRNLLSGKQAVPTVACPSCGAQVPEFRIHSHLDACLTTLPAEDAAPAVAAVGEGAHELSDSEQNRHRRGRARGQGRGRGRSRKRREGAEVKKGRDGVPDGRKKARGDPVEGERGLDAPALSDDEDGDANFYQHWEYTVSGFDELAKARKESLLSNLQKQELFASGVLTIERHEVSALAVELDRLLAGTEGVTDGSSLSLPRFRDGNGFQIPAGNQISAVEQVRSSSARTSAADAEGYDDTSSEQGKALEAWWEQWVTVEWPEGPLPSTFHPSLPRRSRVAQDVHTDAEKVKVERSAAQDTTLMNAHPAVPVKPMQ